jgi:PII-like signaling protein
VIGMWLEGAARRLTILVDESDKAPQGMKPLYTEIVHRAHEAGLAGASVFHGIEGYGTSRHVHVSKVLSLSADLPVAIVIVDVPDKIDDFLPVVKSLVTDGLVTVDDLRAIHRAHPRGASSPEEDRDAERHRGVLHRLTHLGALTHVGRPMDSAE